MSWFLAARLKTLPAAIVPVLAGCLLAFQLRGVFSFPLALATLLGAVAIQIATNFFNDVIDHDKGTDTAKRLGPTRVTASGLIPRRAVMGAAVLALGVATLCGLFLFFERGWLILLIGVPSLFLSYGYTGGPFPLAYLGLGELFVILFFGLIAVGGTVFVQLGEIPALAWVLGLQIGFLSSVLIAVNNYRDLVEDRAAGKRTLAVRFGREALTIFILFATFQPGLLFRFYPEMPWVDAFESRYTWAGTVFVIIFSIVFLKARGTRDVPGWVLGLSALHLVVFLGLMASATGLTSA